jgi:hypothetical protein
MKKQNWLKIALGTILLVILLLACSKKGGTSNEADDGNTPYNILDLTVASVTDNSVKLIWTATGDDADQGTATSYDIRYWHTWINTSNWDSTHQISGEPSPSIAGSKDSITVTGLEKDSTYYFAIKVCDEASNCASSGCVSATCFTDMVVTFTDPNLEAAVRTQISKPTGDIMKSDLTHFNVLEANSQNISNLSGLENWQNLQGLLLGNNHITDLTPLAGLIKLTGLGLTNNTLTNITPLAGLVNLELLHIRSNKIKDISVLSGMTKLHQLDMTQDSISDLTPLVNNTGFATNDTVWLQFNPLSQQDSTVRVPALRARGATVIGL